jgi:hypothetical protein
VILHWACEKIIASTNLPEIVLLESLLDKVCVYQSHTLAYTRYYYMVNAYLLQLYMFPCFTYYMFFLLQLRLCKGISYVAVAAHANNSGRQRLAAMLIDYESQSSKQASLLLCCNSGRYDATD